MLHTLYGPSYTENEKYIIKRDCNHVFPVFFIFRVVGSIEICNMGTSWMRNQILHPTSVAAQNFSKPIGR